jgi:hypothetical protein
VEELTWFDLLSSRGTGEPLISSVLESFRNKQAGLSALAALLESDATCSSHHQPFEVAEPPSKLGAQAVCSSHVTMREVEKVRNLNMVPFPQSNSMSV